MIFINMILLFFSETTSGEEQQIFFDIFQPCLPSLPRLPTPEDWSRISVQNFSSLCAAEQGLL